jgi:Holliday junction DNA helicase RuvA
VKEDNQELYGFASKSERDIFRHLISVSGVGANTARMILSSLTVSETFNAIANDDEVTLQSVKGIGGKTAKRIILDLKDKIIKDNLSEQIIGSSHNTHKNEALTALVNLGFVKNSASKALDKVIADHGSNLSLEDLIKFTLQKL